MPMAATRACVNASAQRAVMSPSKVGAVSCGTPESFANLEANVTVCSKKSSHSCCSSGVKPGITIGRVSRRMLGVIAPCGMALAELSLENLATHESPFVTSMLIRAEVFEKG